jgi:uncharacterized membrane protein
MAVKPWNQITTMQEAVEYISAELAEAQQYCSGSVPQYQTALSQATSYASAAEITGTSDDQWAAIEASLNNARAVWKDAGCTKPAKGGGTTSDPSHEAGAGAGDEYGGGGGGGGGYTGAGIAGGGIGTLLLLAVGGVALYLIYGKKGKGGGKSRKSSRRRR